LYQKHSFVFEYGESLVDLLDPQPGETVLDVGCGSGQLTKEIADRGAVGIGFDADASMVQRAQHEYPNLQFFHADVTTLEMSMSVDAIFSNAALHWVKEADAAVASMAHLLKPDGRFVVEFGGKGNVDKIVKASQKLFGKSENENPWYFPSVAEYCSLLENHGIEVLSATLYDRPTVLEDGKDGMSNWLRMFGGTLLIDIPDQSKDQVIEEIVSKLKVKDSNLFDGETWTADYRRLRIVGRKFA
jgi:trans-aconitate methyltransferase